MSRWAKPVGWMTPNAKAANKIMSGLDGLGWPNPEDEPKPNKTMNSQLEIKLAPTPETDAMEYCDAMCDPDRVVEADFARKLERERDEARGQRDELREWASVNGVSSLAKDRDQFRARLREEQQLHVQMLNERDQLEERLRVELGGHPDSELWGDTGLIAATMRCVDALDGVTEQRDYYKLACDKYSEDEMMNTLQSLKGERDRCQELADGLVDRLVTTQERMINAERICNKIYIARNITHSEESMLSAIAEIDKIYRTKNDGN